MKIFGVHCYIGPHPDKNLTNEEKTQASTPQNATQGPRTIFPGIHVGNKSLKKALEKEARNKNTEHKPAEQNQLPEELLPHPHSATPATILFGKSSRRFLQDHGVDVPRPRNWEGTRFFELPPDAKESEAIEEDGGKSS